MFQGWPENPSNLPGGQAAPPTAVATKVFLGGTQAPPEVGSGLPNRADVRGPSLPLLGQ